MVSPAEPGVAPKRRNLVSESQVGAFEYHGSSEGTSSF